jgi:hypothetical protein
MGVDYSASVGFGYKLPECDDERHEDGWYEYETYYADAMAKEMGITLNSWEDRSKFQRGLDCPINILSFGNGMDGREEHFLCTRESAHYTRYSDNPTTIKLSEPDKAKELLDGFMKLLGYKPPADQPKWYFGMYVS